MLAPTLEDVPAFWLTPATADADRVTRALSETGAQTELEEAGWQGYLAHLVKTFEQWLYSRAEQLFAGLPITAGMLKMLLQGLVILALAGVLFLLVRWLLRRWNRRLPGREGDALDGEVEAALAPRQGAEAWRRAMEEHLAAGRGRAALGALWWWLAEATVPGEVDPSWTSRQLLRRAREPRLRPAVARLDGLLYGAQEPSLESVRAVDHALREVAG
ncbi:MAG: hypothetical protein AAGD01_16900 [Acidobacteriota bacterium]